MKVLITRELPQAGINILNIYKDRIKLDYRQGDPLSEKDLKEAIKDADAIIPVIPDQINKDVIKAGKKLKVIATYSVGYDHIDVEAATKAGVYVANTPGDLTEAVAEHTIALMMSLGRKIVEGDKYCRKGKYEFWEPLLYIGPKFMNKTLGIVGFGRIGQHLARIAKYGFNMRILYNDPIRHTEAERLLDAEKVDMDYLLEQSDIISLNCNLTESTHHLFGEPQFRKMKPFAYIINTARGPVINEEALVMALKEGWIAGAALDVFENEPEIHKDLIKMDNVVLTPHIASATWEARIQMARMASESVVDVLINNTAPRYLVNKELADKEKAVTSLA